MSDFQSLTEFDAALKDDYSPGLRNAINNSNVVLSEVERNDTDIVGRQAVWSLHHSRSHSTQARAEGTVLDTGGHQQYEDPKENLAFLYQLAQAA